MNNKIKLIIIGAIIGVSFYCSSASQKSIDKLLSESEGIQDLSDAVSMVLEQLGLSPSITIKSPLLPRLIDEFKQILPDDLTTLKNFIMDIPKQSFIEYAEQQVVKYCHNALCQAKISKKVGIGSLSFIIEQYLINRVQESLINHYMSSHPQLSETDKSSLRHLTLHMCTCDEAPTAKRIVLILDSINEILQHLDVNDPVIITSLNPGGLLMEYLLMAGLQRVGYMYITFNLIDQNYKPLKDPSDKGYGKMQSLERFSSQVDLSLNFCNAGKINSAQLNAINVYDTMQTYRDECKNNPDLKSTIMLAVDASMQEISTHYSASVKGTKDEIKPEINRVDISYSCGDYVRDLVIYFPVNCNLTNLLG